MYHGIIQERQWSGPGTLPARQDRAVPARQGGQLRPHLAAALRRPARPCRRPTRTRASRRSRRIAPNFASPRAVRRDAGPAGGAPLANQNGWHRDMAQRLLVLSAGQVGRPGAAADGPVVDEPARRGSTRCGRSKASGALDAGLVREEMKDANPRMRIQAIRASETLYKAGDKTLAADYRAMAKDADPNVAIQAMLTLNLFKVPDAADVIKAARPPAARRACSSSRDNLLEPAGQQRASAAAAGRGADAGAAEADAAGRRRLRRRLLLLPRAPTAAASRWPARRPGR